MPKDLAIILNNGSVNSAVITALAAQRFRVVLLHGESGPASGSGTGRRLAYDAQGAHFKPYREQTLSLPPMQAGPAAGAGEAMIRGVATSALLARQLVNLLPLLALAGQAAASFEAAALYLGLRVGAASDALAQASEYVQVWSELLQLPCAMPELTIETPLLELEPWQVVDLGVQVSAPLEKTWSCEEAGPEPCWACASCRAREAAFQQAAKPDPLKTPKRH